MKNEVSRTRDASQWKPRRDREQVAEENVYNQNILKP